MIEKLTKQQEEMMYVVRDHWLNKMFGGFKEIDRDKATKGIEWLYKISNLEKPKVIFVSSPLGVQLACNILGRSNVESNVLSNVRSNVGSNVRSNLGSNVGSNVESNVESNVRSNVGSNVWSNVWSNVESNVRSNVGSNVRSNVESNVESNVWSNVWSNVRSNVRSNVESNVGSNVESNVESNVRSNVESNVESNVRSNGLQYFSFSSYGDVSDYGWLAYYEYFEQIGLKYSKEELAGLHNMIDLMDSNIYDMVQLDKFCIVCEKPNYLTRDARNRLHNEERSAVSWRDTYEQHYLFGVHFAKDLWKKVVGKQLSFKEIMSMENIEQRMVALKMMKPEELLTEAKAELINKSARGNELYLIKDLFSIPAYFLKYSCPSTGRVYISGIDPQYAKENPLADDCMAWKHNMTIDEYKMLEIEA